MMSRSRPTERCILRRSTRRITQTDGCSSTTRRAAVSQISHLPIDPNVSPARTLIDEQFYGGFSLDYSGGNPNFLVYADVKNNYFLSLHGRGAFSTDGGQNWSLFKATPPNNIGGDITVSATDVNNLVWLPSTGDIKQGKTPYYSVDRGQVWRASKGVTSTKTHGLFWWHEKRALAADMVSAGTFYLLTYDNDGEFYVSTDGGANFAKAANSPRCNEADDCHVWGELRAAPGKAGHLWSTANRGGLYYTTDAGATPWVKVPQVQQARKIGFGKAAPGASYPTIFLHGKINDVDGLWRSTDQGQTWDLLAEHPGGLYAGISAVSGDMAIFGRVYVAIGGVSFVYGDIAGSNPTPPPLPTPDPNPTLPPPTQPPTPVPGQGTITVYDDDNGDGWYRFNWGSTVTETTTTVYTGTKALSVEYVGGWGALAFGRFKAPYSTTGYNAISFWAHGGSTASTRKFQVYTNPGGEGFPNSKAAVVDVSLPANAWTEVSVPLSALGNPTQIGQLFIQNGTPASQPQFFIDAVWLVGAGGEEPPPPAGPQLTAAKVSAPMAIDGGLSETSWNVTTPITKTVNGTTSVTATFGVAWDDTYLYVGVKALDNSLQNDSALYPWQDDSVEVYIDGNNDRATSYNNTFDRQIVKGWNDETLWVNQNLTTGIQHAWANTAGGYSIELAIPWNNMTLTGTVGLKIGLDVGVNDDDNGGDREGQTVAFGFRDNWADLSKVAQVTLVEGSAPPDKAVRPVLECVVDNGGGNYTAWFGYKNENAVAVNIPVGNNNKFHPTPQDRGQPTAFQPGRKQKVFSVPFNGANLVWSLKGPDGQNRTSTASSGSRRC